MHARRQRARILLPCLLVLCEAAIVGCNAPPPPHSVSPQSRTSAPVHATVAHPRVEHSTAARPGAAAGGAGTGGGSHSVALPKPIPAPVPRSESPVPPPPPPPSPVAGPDDPQRKTVDPIATLLHNYEQALQQGFIEYNPPAQMTVGTAETIAVRVRRERMPKLPAASSSEPSLPGQIISNSLSVYPRMRVALTSNSGAAFSITPDPSVPPTQTVPGNGFAEWRWQVMPSSSGANKTLVVTAWADLSDQHLDPILIQEYVAEVNVQVAPSPPPPTLGQRMQSFVSKNWQWLWAAIVIPLLGWLARWRNKKKDPPA